MSRESGSNGCMEANVLPALPHLTPAAQPGRFNLSSGMGKFPEEQSPSQRVAGPDGGCLGRSQAQSRRGAC